MSEEKKKEPKAKLDSDDIITELGLGDDKAAVDSEGLPETAGLDDKAVLDAEGILNEEVPQELEVPRAAAPPRPADKKEEPAAVKPAGARLPSWVNPERLRQLPWLKIAALGGGTLVLFCAGWLMVGLLLSPASPDSESADQDTTTEAVGDAADTDNEQEALTLELEPFVIPVADAKKQTAFLRISVVLHAQQNSEDAIQRESTSIRSTIYNLLSHRDGKDILDEEKQEAMRQELRKLLNTLLRQELILGVRFSRVLLV